MRDPARPRSGAAPPHAMRVSKKSQWKEILNEKPLLLDPARQSRLFGADANPMLG
jgi:hypothetical protein